MMTGAGGLRVHGFPWARTFVIKLELLTLPNPYLNSKVGVATRVHGNQSYWIGVQTDLAGFQLG